MFRRPNSIFGWALVVILGVGLLWLFYSFTFNCCRYPAERENPDRAELGVLTSLPLVWPIEARFEDLAAGRFEKTWQRIALERTHDLRPLDTLAWQDAVAEDGPIDPLAELDRLAIIQPRGLSPVDNVALDQWVRAGGHVLMAVDPALTGEYELPLGDPRRPPVEAFLPPILNRWGLSMVFDEGQNPESRFVSLGQADLPIVLSGIWQLSPTDHADCMVMSGGVVAHCQVGEGQALLLADAALFEHSEWDRPTGSPLDIVLEIAFSREDSSER